MRTRMVRVRRERPSGVIWALSLMLITLAIYLITSAPTVRSALSVNQSIAGQSGVTDTANLPRVTKEIVFGGIDYYLIQFGAYADIENARIEAARYVKRGAAGYVLDDMMFRVIGAGYETQEEAEKVKDRLYEQEGMNCIIYPVQADEVTLRVTATQPQIDALAAAQLAFDEQAGALGALAFQIDAGEVSAASAKEVLASMENTVKAARSELSDQAGESPNEVAAGLMELSQTLESALSSLKTDDSQSLLSFSSKIKYNTIELRIQYAEYLKKLAA